MSENTPQATPEISPETYSAFVRKLFNRSGDPSKDFTHAILGIVTEIHELEQATDDVNALEEIGDMQFYLAALVQVVDDFLDSLPKSDVQQMVLKGHMTLDVQSPEHARAVVLDSCNALLDIAKRWVGYGKVPGDIINLPGFAVAVCDAANEFGEYPCLDTEKAAAANMAKLLVRYPGGEFDQYRALNRDLGAERAVLASA